MRNVLVLATVLFGLAACTVPVTMIHPQTREERVCGPYPGPLYYGRLEQDKCVADYKEQGYVRK